MRALDSVRDRLSSHCVKWPPSLDAKFRSSHQDPYTRRLLLGDISTSSSWQRDASSSLRKVSSIGEETLDASTQKRRNMALAPVPKSIILILLLLSASGQWKQVSAQDSNKMRLCQNATDTDCEVFRGPDHMSWQDAQRYCRRNDGFLLAKDEVTRFFRNNSTWTAVTRHEGKVQWIQEYPVVDDTWIDWLEESLKRGWKSSECLAWSDKVRYPLEFLSCSENLDFYCKKGQSRISLSEIDFDDMELRVKSSVEAKSGLVTVNESEFSDLHLTCEAYHKSTNERFDHQPPVFWTKDGAYFNFNKNRIIPAVDYNHILVFDGSKRTYDIPKEIQLSQGTFGCEAWKPKALKPLVSNKILISLKNWIVLILSAHTLSSLDDLLLYNTTSHLRNSFRDHLPDIDSYIIEPVSAKSDDFIEKETDVHVNYTFLVHIPSNSFQSVQNLLSERTYKNVYIENGYLNTSSASLATFCLEHTELYDLGNEIELSWSFTHAGKVSPENFKREILKSTLEPPGHCHWNYTHGAWLDFDSSTSQCFDCCPNDYIVIANHFCAFIMDPGTWDKGFRNFYKTGLETDILAANIHQQIYSHIKAKAANRSLNQLWLPIKRKVQWGPLQRINPHESGIFTNPPESNISWADGHPESDKECLALDIVEDLLLTLDCNNNLLPFISVTDISNLRNLSNYDWASSLPKLITQSFDCGNKGNTTSTNNNDLLCFQLSLDRGNNTWNDARDFCVNLSSLLPNSGIRYLDWVSKQYIQNKTIIDVWMTYQKSPQDKLTNMDKLVQNTFSAKGWLLENNSTLETNIMCQRKISQEKLPRIEFHSPTEKMNTDMCINMNFDVTELDQVSQIQCFVNGRSESPTYRPKENCQLVIETIRQGYYQCHTWVGSPLTFSESPSLLKRDPQLVTFAVSLVEEDIIYLPKEHDSTFTNFTLGKEYPPRCTGKFIKELKKGLQNFIIPEMTANVSNFYFSPEPKNGHLLHNFHLELRKEGEMENTTEEELLKKIAEHFKSTEHDCRFYSINNTVGCIKDITKDCNNSGKNLTWLETKGQAIALPDKLRLTEDKLPVSRECKGNFLEGYHWDSHAESCQTAASKTTQKLWNITRSDGDVMKELVTVINPQSSSSLIPADIKLIAEAFQIVSATDSVTDSDLKDLIKVLDNIMDASTNSFEKAQENFDSSRIMIEAVENITFKAKYLDDPNEEYIMESGKTVSVARLKLDVKSKIIGFKFGNDPKQIGKLNEGAEIDKLSAKAAVIFPENFSCADHESPSKGQSDGKENYQIVLGLYTDPKPFQNNESFPNFSISNNVVFQVKCNGINVQNLSHPIQLLFKSLGNEITSECVYWDFQENSGRGGWSTSGCKKGNIVGNYLTCECSHFTCFTLLVKVDGESDGGHALPLRIISIIGSIFSIVGLMLVFTTYLFFKLWRKPERNKILVNLSLSIFCTLVIFVGGIKLTWDDNLCRGVAITLHYFIMASFGWMLVEAVHQYLLFVRVFNTYIPSFMMKASACAWGLPFLPIMAALIYDKTLYDHDSKREDKICWMSTTGIKYVFLPPLVLTMAINLFIFSVIIYRIFWKHSSIRSTLSRNRHKNQIKMAVSNFFLLGLTWIFGLLAVGGWGSHFFSYLFCIFNSLQGFFIFFFFLYKENKAQKLWGIFLSILRSDQLFNNPPQKFTFSNTNENVKSALRRGIENFSQDPSTHTTAEENIELSSTTSVHK